ncbi:MAG: hypothetical protein LBC99_08535 [Spirochaetota bacterium]|jgi:phosphomevalonate kinase|nr:hypothetical protein [Spirochaetota bacterium]
MIREVLVPGNLLLSGEYAVTLPGGRGVALALHKTLRLCIEPAPAFSFRGSAGGRSLNGKRLIRAVFKVLAKEYNIHKIDSRFFYALHADSEDFYASGGRKLGYGSSAALVVALVTAMLSRLGALEKRSRQEGRERIARFALAAHRLYQGGGSGYDVYASTFGGLGLFTGGKRPNWKALPMAGLPHPLYLAHGTEAARSGEAAQSFSAWCAQHPREMNEFLRASNRASLALARAIRKAKPVSVFAGALEAARDCGLYIGRELGRDPESGENTLGARLAALREMGYAAKASGAGDELAFAFRTQSAYTSSYSAPDCIEGGEIAHEGVQWH